jgi:hypothetical protein
LGTIADEYSSTSGLMLLSHFDRRKDFDFFSADGSPYENKQRFLIDLNLKL